MGITDGIGPEYWKSIKLNIGIMFSPRLSGIFLQPASIEKKPPG
jgi:hypothetical protein